MPSLPDEILSIGIVSSIQYSQSNQLKLMTFAQGLNNSCLHCYYCSALQKCATWQIMTQLSRLRHTKKCMCEQQEPVGL